MGSDNSSFKIIQQALQSMANVFRLGQFLARSHWDEWNAKAVKQRPCFCLTCAGPLASGFLEKQLTSVRTHLFRKCCSTALKCMVDFDGLSWVLSWINLQFSIVNTLFLSGSVGLPCFLARYCSISSFSYNLPQFPLHPLIPFFTLSPHYLLLHPFVSESIYAFPLLRQTSASVQISSSEGFPVI